jgi:catechol 2,3-dioxygenase-like lactoylglutathione lyase family enzyme
MSCSGAGRTCLAYRRWDDQQGPARVTHVSMPTLPHSCFAVKPCAKPQQLHEQAFELHTCSSYFHVITMITGLHHVNLVVPPSTLHLAHEFYSDTLGLTSRAVPQLQRDTLAWFDMGTSGQQVHIAMGKPEDFTHTSSRHPCFRVGSVEDLVVLRQKIWDHYERGGDAAPKEADKPGEKSSGAEGVEYPTRFFARDFAGNRLEFSV